MLLYEGSRGFAELDEWLRRGYTQSPRLSLLKSPSARSGRAKGWCSAAGLAALDVRTPLSADIGFLGGSRGGRRARARADGPLRARLLYLA